MRGECAAAAEACQGGAQAVIRLQAQKPAEGEAVH
jgi:hypothetical protein